MNIIITFYSLSYLIASELDIINVLSRGFSADNLFLKYEGRGDS